MQISRRAFIAGLTAVAVAPVAAKVIAQTAGSRVNSWGGYVNPHAEDVAATVLADMERKLLPGRKYMVAITPDSKFVRVRHTNGRRIADVPIANVNLNQREGWTVFGHDPFPPITHEWQTLTLVS